MKKTITAAAAAAVLLMGVVPAEAQDDIRISAVGGKEKISGRVLGPLEAETKWWIKQRGKTVLKGTGESFRKTVPPGRYTVKFAGRSLKIQPRILFSEARDTRYYECQFDTAKQAFVVRESVTSWQQRGTGDSDVVRIEAGKEAGKYQIDSYFSFETPPLGAILLGVETTPPEYGRYFNAETNLYTVGWHHGDRPARVGPKEQVKVYSGPRYIDYYDPYNVSDDWSGAVHYAVPAKAGDEGWYEPFHLVDHYKVDGWVECRKRTSPTAIYWGAFNARIKNVDTLVSAGIPDDTTLRLDRGTLPDFTKSARVTVKAKPAPKPKPKPKSSQGGWSYANCTAARAAGAAPVYRGDPGYGSHLDADNDGVGCE